MSRPAAPWRPGRQTGPPPWPAGSEAIVTDDFGKRWNTRTRNEPWMIGGRYVVGIEGIAGGYDCGRIEITAHHPNLKHFRDRKTTQEQA